MQTQRRALPSAWIFFATLLTVATVSLTAAGCSSRSGRRVSNTSSAANFQVMNNSLVELEVWVDHDRLGVIAPGTLNSFDVINGTRTVFLREGTGELMYFGRYDFFFDRILRIDYQTGLHNFSVTNNTGVTLNVILDGVEIEGVEPQTTSLITVAPGLHEVYFRERGSSFVDFIGVIDFPPATLNGGVVLTHGP